MSTKSSLKKIKLFDSIAKYSVYVLAALLPLFFLPTSLIELDQAKIGLFILVITVAAISLGISSIYSRSTKLINKKVLIPVVLISAVTFISAIFSTSYKGTFLGLGTELDSWYMVSIFLLSVILISSIINTKEKIFTTLSIFWAGFGIASLFQIIRLLAFSIGGDKISGLFTLGGLFDLPALNTVGTWADFGIMAGVVALSIAMTIDMVPLKSSIKKLTWCIFGLSTVMAFIGSSLLVGSGLDQLVGGSSFVIPSITMVGLFALIFSVFQLLMRRRQDKDKDKDKDKETLQSSDPSLSLSPGSTIFPIASIILVIAGIIIMISPLALNQKINHVYSVSNESVLNIRPGFSDTYEVSKAAVSSSIKNLLVGIGPHGFYVAWNQYRPIYINTLEMWNTDLQFGIGYLPTILINNGIIAFLLWIVSLALLFFLSAKAILKRGKKDVASVYVDVIIFFTTLFLWVNMIINISGSAIIILTFVMTGIMVSNLVLDKYIKVANLSWSGAFSGESNFAQKITKDNVGIFVIEICLVLMICFAFLWVQRTRAQFYSTQSMQMVYAKTASISTVPKALDLLEKSFDIYHSDVYARGINNLALVQVNYEVTSDPLNQNLQAGQQIKMTQSAGDYLKLAVDSSRASIDANPNDFRNLLQFGSTVQTAALITSDEESGKLALQSMIQAQSLASNHPLPLYSIANLYVLAGDKESALTVLAEVLRLKPNFAEASELYQRLLNDKASAGLENATTTPETSVKKATTTSAKAPVKKTTPKKTPVKKAVK